MANKDDGGFQLDLSFPVLPGEKGFDPSLATGLARVFVGFEGQGELLVRCPRPEEFRIFVNGREVALPGTDANAATRDGAAGAWAGIDISALTTNGDNQLLVCWVGEKDGRSAAGGGAGAGETGATTVEAEAATGAPAEEAPRLEVRVPYPTLRDACAEWADDPALVLLDQIIEAEVAAGFPSAQLVVVRDGAVVRRSHHGSLNSYRPNGEPIDASERVAVTDDTLYDLASNTKMYACNFALQQLVSEGRVDVDALVSDYLPAFGDRSGCGPIEGKGRLTVRELLEHQAGFPADPSYHNLDYDPAQHKVVPGSHANAALFTQSRDEALEKIVATPLEYEPGTATRYSDVDYMLLGMIVEAVSGQRLDDYASERIYGPLGLEHTTYRPLDHGFSRTDCAATELRGNTRDGAVSFPGVRRGTVQGEVHDAKAFHVMGGVSGHAGLFSCASDLAVLQQAVINRGGYGRVRLFDMDTLDRFLKPKDTDPTYGLGWRREADGEFSRFLSGLADPAAVGHTGFTGTLGVIDPVQHVAVAMLANVRNSPVVDPAADPNDFAAQHYLAGRYALAATLAYMAGRATVEACDALLAALVRAKRAGVESGALAAEADRADLAALEALLERRTGERR